MTRELAATLARRRNLPIVSGGSLPARPGTGQRPPRFARARCAVQGVRARGGGGVNPALRSLSRKERASQATLVALDNRFYRGLRNTAIYGTLLLPPPFARRLFLVMEHRMRQLSLTIAMICASVLFFWQPASAQFSCDEFNFGQNDCPDGAGGGGSVRPGGGGGTGISPGRPRVKPGTRWVVAHEEPNGKGALRFVGNGKYEYCTANIIKDRMQRIELQVWSHEFVPAIYLFNRAGRTMSKALAPRKQKNCGGRRCWVAYFEGEMPPDAGTLCVTPTYEVFPSNVGRQGPKFFFHSIRLEWR